MSLCYQCFHEKKADGACPHCGFDPTGQAGKYPIALKYGAILNGRYIVGRVLGQGGFGITYIALNDQTGERVAIKEYLPADLAGRGSDGASVQVYSGNREENFAYGKKLFLEEAKTLAEFIGDEHIVRIYSYFEENGTAYFVMEYVDGPSLKQYMIQRGGRLSVAEAGYLLLPLMDSLGRVHRKGIIHRDIAPDNIIIERNERAKMIDFGAARYSTGELSQSLDVILKHGFAPKEQYTRRGRQGPWTDVYAMAATFYYTLTGKVPPDAIARSDTDELAAPSALGFAISEKAEQVLLKGLALAAQDRWQSMAEFHRAMQSAIFAEFQSERVRQESDDGNAAGSETKAREEAQRREQEQAARLEAANRERERIAREEAERLAREAAEHANEGSAQLNTKDHGSADLSAGQRPGKKKRLPLLIGAAAAAILLIFGASRVWKPTPSQAVASPAAEAELSAAEEVSSAAEAAVAAAEEAAAAVEEAIAPAAEAKPSPELTPEPTPAPMAMTEDGLKYVIYGDHAAVVGTDGAGDEIRIPETVGGQPVTAIEAEAFYGVNAKSIVLPKSVNAIGEAAFAGTGDKNSPLASITVAEGNETYCSVDGIVYTRDMLELVAYPPGLAGSYTVPETVEAFGPFAMYGCRRLSSISFPESVRSLGKYAMGCCTELTFVSTPKSLTSIGDYCFTGCSLMRFISISENVTSIGDGAFLGCSILKEFTLPAKLESIGDSVFLYCDSLEAFKVAEGNEKFIINGGALYNRETKELIVYPLASRTANIIVWDEAKRISRNAFLNSKYIRYVTLPDTLTSIGSNAFSGCDELKRITIPEGVQSIEDSTFAGCVLMDSFVLPSTVTNIGENAFLGCKMLTDVTIPEGVMVIGNNAFSGCTALKHISLPETLIDIGSGAFSGCAFLEEITIPAGVSSIGAGAFANSNPYMKLHVKPDSYAATALADDTRLILDA